MNTRLATFLILATVILTNCDRRETESPAGDWAHYLGNPGTSQYSALADINTDNVGELALAWTYESGDLDTAAQSQIQCNPLVVDGILYGTNPRLKAFALDAATGEELWVFDPAAFEGDFFRMGTNRGLAYWEAPEGERDLLFYSAGAFLIALDATTGEPRETFGTDGRVDLHTGLGEGTEDLFVISTSPGVVYEDLIIMGSRVSEDVGAAPGNIRAFDVRTGALRWMFRTLPEDGIGGANVWSGFSLDPDRGWVFAGTGSASYDFYGGNRPGNNEYANCILALNAATGELIWHYQTVHHDLWDRDHPAPPVLLTVKHDGKPVEAVAQTTKSGYVFLLNRETGEPLFPVEEKPFPASELPGEYTSPTQPIPSLPPPFARQSIDPEELYPFDPELNAEARATLASHNYGGQYLPPSERGTIIFPGFDGGAEWGGAAYDKATGLLYVNANEMPCMIKMNPVAALDELSPGHSVYTVACQACHGTKLGGGGVFDSPSILGVAERYSVAELRTLVQNGKGAMPAINWLEDDQLVAVTEWLHDLKTEEDITVGEGEHSAAPPRKKNWPYPYIMEGYQRVKTSNGYPIVAPPWGTLTAIDLNAGSIRWQIPFGEHPELVERGITNTGSENYGGPVVTAGGLLFIAATLDEKMRVYRAADGELLWEYQLPAAGYATPAVYSAGGRQYVVIACGGGKIGSESGDRYLAFAIPPADDGKN